MTGDIGSYEEALREIRREHKHLQALLQQMETLLEARVSADPDERELATGLAELESIANDPDYA